LIKEEEPNTFECINLVKKKNVKRKNLIKEEEPNTF